MIRNNRNSNHSQQFNNTQNNARAPYQGRNNAFQGQNDKRAMYSSQNNARAPFQNQNRQSNNSYQNNQQFGNANFQRNSQYTNHARPFSQNNHDMNAQN